MFESLFVIALLVFVGAVLIGLLKLFLSLVLLPLKLGVWIVKGIVGLVLIVPIAILSLLALSTIIPVIIGIIAIPIILVVVGVLALVDFLA